MYIDIHSHAYWKPIPFVTKFFTPEQLIAAQDKNGIEKGVLLPVAIILLSPPANVKLHLKKTALLPAKTNRFAAGQKITVVCRVIIRQHGRHQQ